MRETAPHPYPNPYPYPYPNEAVAAVRRFSPSAGLGDLLGCATLNTGRTT